jgi:hypothetical protein
MFTSCNINTPSHGEKIGRIVKLADEGLVNKTCEGELIRGGLIDGSGSMGSSFHFVIEDERIKMIAKQAMMNQQEIIMTYKVELISAAWRSEDNHPHFVTDIRLVK